MASPIPRPQPPQARVTKTGATKPVPPSSTLIQPQAQSAPPKLPAKPSLYGRYRALSLKVKLYIWITTAGAAWLADSLSDRIFEQNMIDAEANRRVEMEIRKMRELEQQERIMDPTNKK